jgi:hypothetical protein
MVDFTVCPKELYCKEVISSDFINEFEQKTIVPLIELIEDCAAKDISIKMSFDLLNLIISRAPWADSSNDKILPYLNSWYQAVISTLERYATSSTSGDGSYSNCDELNDAEINNHFKEFLSQEGSNSNKTIKRLNHFGIHVKNKCPQNVECSCNIFMQDKGEARFLQHPWYIIYPEKLPAIGEKPFVPPNDWEKLDSPRKSTSGKGYLDVNGHSWEWDHLHNNHWDVQRGGTGNYTNVCPKGKILDKT